MNDFERKSDEQYNAVLRDEQELQSKKLEEIGQVAAAIAHDFNNLLSIILSFSSFIADDVPKNSATYEDIHEIKKAAERGAALTRQLLIFSRKEVVKPSVLNPEEVLTGIDRLIRSSMRENVEFLMKFQSTPWNIEVDPGQFEMVIMNLALNARDAMPKGGRFVVKVENISVDETFVGSKYVMESGNYVLLEFSDTGCGMSKEVSQHVFDPFFTTKPKGKGTGLGLSTVYGIVKRAHGYIKVYSEENVGTTFKIYLPAVDQSPAKSSSEEVSVREGKGKETILVVEDETPIRQAIRRVLEKRGYKVLEAKNGVHALSVTKNYSEKIHLLITDVIMPELSGRDLAERLLKERPDMNVLYISGYDGHVIDFHGFLYQGALLLQKPFTRSVLLEKVKQAITRSVN